MVGKGLKCIIHLYINPNTTFYSYYFFPRTPRSDSRCFLLKQKNISCCEAKQFVMREGKIKAIAECDSFLIF